MGCKDCEPDISLPVCTTDADCGGGTCYRHLAAHAGTTERRAQSLPRPLDALPVRIHDLVASAPRERRHRRTAARADRALHCGLAGRDRRAGVQFAARSEVRVLIGQFPPVGVDAAAFLKELVETARDIPGSRVTVSVSAMPAARCSTPATASRGTTASSSSSMGRRPLSVAQPLDRDYLHRQSGSRSFDAGAGPAAASASRFADRLCTTSATIWITRSRFRW